LGIINRSDDDDGLVTLTLDDGKLNALDAGVFRELSGALSDANGAPAVLITGREGVFTAGLNTKILDGISGEDLRTLLEVFGRTVMQLWCEPRPVVAACTGHAIAAGTMLAMAADHAVAAGGDFRWGLTETRIGFPLPQFAIALARANVRDDRLDDLLLSGAIVGPEEAVSVGFADELAEPAAVLDRARERAHTLMELPADAYAATKRRLRGDIAQQVLSQLGEDLDDILRSRDT
jgi:enoyl-CoA hydratase